MTKQLIFIGTVSAPNPIYHRNALKNVTEFKTWSYEYYRTYPYLRARSGSSPTRADRLTQDRKAGPQTFRICEGLRLGLTS